MICKIIPAQSFSQELLYLFKDGSVKLFSNAVRNTPQEINADMELYRSAKPDLKFPCLHLMVSFHAEDKNKLNKEIMTDIGQEILKRFRVTDKFQFVALQHTDGGNPHFHICINRVGEDGKVLDDSFAKTSLNRIRLQLEKEYPQLKVAESKNIGETNMEKLRGTDKIKYEIYNAINKEIPLCRSINDLIKRLDGKHGIMTDLKYKRGSSEIQGIKFYKDNVWLKGSEIDKQCSYNKLVLRIENTMSLTHKMEESLIKKAESDSFFSVTPHPHFTPSQALNFIKDLLIDEGNPEDNTILNKGSDYVRRTKGKKFRRM